MPVISRHFARNAKCRVQCRLPIFMPIAYCQVLCRLPSFMPIAEFYAEAELYAEAEFYAK